MKRVFSIAILALTVSGCVVRSRPVHHHHNEPRRVERRAPPPPRGCPAAYHMSGGVCVQNR